MKLSFFVASTPGLEAITLKEARALGYSRAKLVEGGIHIVGAMRDLYRCNYQLRTASRILLRVWEGGVHQFSDITRAIDELELSAFADAATPIAVSATSHSSTLYHTGGIERAALEGICAQGHLAAESRSEETARPSLLMTIRIVRNWCTISIDTSGTPLYQRGYKEQVGAAPLRETLAAAILEVIPWSSSTPLIDPFCGSGTIPIEAALRAHRIPPGTGRSFGFQHWPQYNRGAWASVVSEGTASATPREEHPFTIVGSDIDPDILAAARLNAERARVVDHLTFLEQDARDFQPAAPESLIVANPPYGGRLGDPRAVYDLLSRFGAAVQKRAKGSTLAILLPAGIPPTVLGISLEEKMCFLHGGKRVRLYVGSVGS